jgi:hypothetical protein
LIWLSSNSFKCSFKFLTIVQPSVLQTRSKKAVQREVDM